MNRQQSIVDELMARGLSADDANYAATQLIKLHNVRGGPDLLYALAHAEAALEYVVRHSPQGDERADVAGKALDHARAAIANATETPT